MIDWNAVRDMYLSGEPAHRVARHFNITQRQFARRARLDGFRRVDVGQRVTKDSPDDEGALVAGAMRAALAAARKGDAKGIEMAARAIERVVRACTLIAQHAPPPAQSSRADEDKHTNQLVEIYEAQRRYEAGERGDGAMPLWQRFDRPDLRKPGEMPVVYWWRGAGPGREPVKPSPEDALYRMEVSWISEGLIAAHSEDTANFRSQLAQAAEEAETGQA